MPWDALLVASVRGILRHHGIPSGSVVVDDTDTPRAKAATKLAHLYKRRDKESGGSLWGPSLVLLFLVPPHISMPVGCVFSPPDPALRAWYHREKTLKKPQAPQAQRPPTPAPNPQYPTQQPLARRLLEAFKTHHPAMRGHCSTAEALSGTAPLVDAASALCGGVQVLSHIRRHHNRRIGTRDQHVADSVATHPGLPQRLRIRGGAEVVAMVSRARFSVCAHTTTRVVVAMKYANAETSRSLLASDRSWRTLALVQGQTLRWVVEVFLADGKAHEGWSQLTNQPGAEGARHRVILSLLVEHRLFVHPDHHPQRTNNLPAYTVGSRRAHVQVGCLVDVIEDRVSSEEPREQLKRLTQAVHEVCAFRRCKKHMIQRQLGRLEPTPSLKYRAHEVMRNMPVMST